jgi:hypothetical protein
MVLCSSAMLFKHHALLLVSGFLASWWMLTVSALFTFQGG